MNGREMRGERTDFPHVRAGLNIRSLGLGLGENGDTGMITLNQPLLINILGHAAGALIFGIFLALLFSSRGWSGDRGRNLSAFAATLSLLWNLGSLVALTWPGLSPSLAAWLVAISFSVLSLLPAVLLQISLERRLPALVVAGYLLSATAAVMHFWEIRGHGAELHQAALLLITIGFLALTGIVVAAGIVQREEPLRPGTGRIAASMCLALFAMSFVHFGSSHAGQAWSAELVVHHAGIPLALFVLLQDYRFVLLDAFVRFMANALLAAVLTLLVIEAAYRLGLVERAPRSAATRPAAFERMPFSGVLRVAAQPGAAMAYARGFPAR